MSILIWGSRPKSVALADAGVRKCERCGLARPHTFVVDYTLNHLYYLFGFVSGRQVACRCTVCGEAAVAALDPALEMRSRTAIPALERFGCLGLAAGLAILVLFAVAWSELGPQPRNVPDLMARVQRGDTAAMARLEVEAQGGDLPSQLALAQLLRDGHGVAAEPERAFFWAKKAAEQGSASAQLAIGVMCEFGQGTAVDPAAATVWYRKAAEQGSAAAANALGAALLRGVGVPADAAQAVAWFQRAADGGDVLGQFNLAMRYFNGDGVPADPVTARRWLEKAAAAVGEDSTTRSVVASSQQELGVIYEEGLGVERDLVKALRFYDEARELNEDARLNFDRLKARLNG